MKRTYYDYLMGSIREIRNYVTNNEDQAITYIVTGTSKYYLAIIKSINYKKVK